MNERCEAVELAEIVVKDKEINDLRKQIGDFEIERTFGKRDVQKHGQMMFDIYKETKRIFCGGEKQGDEQV